MKAEKFISLLKGNGIQDFTGVPCSVFKDVLHLLEKETGYLIATNEGEAMGIAAGISLAEKIPAVFMQNDGLGNALNPITSLQKLYQLPALLIISWRGEPGKKDAPQHLWSGKTLLDLLNVLDIEYFFLDQKDPEALLSSLINRIRTNNSIGAVICRKGVFEKISLSSGAVQKNRLTRERAVETIMGIIDQNTPVFSTTGKCSREIYDFKDRPNNFYVMGSMGCTSSIALGYIQKVKNKTVIIDGDGAVLMHMGNLATIGYYQPKAFLHICLDNETYESTGGQTAVSKKINLSEIARACQYQRVGTAVEESEIIDFIKNWEKNPRLSFLHVKVRNESNPELGRPREEPVELKNRFIKNKFLLS